MSLLTQNQNQLSSKSALIDRKIEDTMKGLAVSCAKVLRIISEQNAETIADYIAAIRVETNPSDHYRRDMIEAIINICKTCRK